MKKRKKKHEILHTAEDVARWVLWYNDCQVKRAGDSVEFISNQKLQKLLYFLQGAFLGIENRALFKDKLLKYAHGFAVGKVYQKYQSFGAMGITWIEEPYEYYTEDEEELMQDVLNKLSIYSAVGLENRIVLQRLWQTTKTNQKVSVDRIREHFIEHELT